MPSLHHAAAMRVDPDVWPLTARVDAEGRLCVGDVPLCEIADQFGTPAYVLDEADFRYRIRRYRSALRGVRIVYAGNAKTTGELRAAADAGVGRIVIDCGTEIALLA